MTATDHIRRVSLVPADPTAPADARRRALAEADQIVLGPGSLFTSVLAAVAVPEIREGINRSRGPKVYVCNLRPQVPETAGFDVGHARRRPSLAHGVAVDVVVCDTSGIATGRPPGVEVVDAPWPGPTDWPTTRPNWRRPSRICSDDALDRPDALAWTPVSVRRRGAGDHGHACGPGRRRHDEG